jgi:hypothetical protein
MKTNAWGKTQRSWGFEVRVDFTDEDAGKIYNEVLVFDKEPDESTLESAIIEYEEELVIRIEQQAEFEAELLAEEIAKMNELIDAKIEIDRLTKENKELQDEIDDLTGVYL